MKRRLWVSIAVLALEHLNLFLGDRFGLGLANLVKVLLRAWPQTLRQLVENVRSAMNLSTLLGCLRPHFTERLPEPKRTVTNRKQRHFEAAMLNIAKHG